MYDVRHQIDSTQKTMENEEKKKSAKKELLIEKADQADGDAEDRARVQGVFQAFHAKDLFQDNAQQLSAIKRHDGQQINRRPKEGDDAH